MDSTVPFPFFHFFDKLDIKPPRYTKCAILNKEEQA